MSQIWVFGCLGWPRRHSLSHHWLFDPLLIKIKSKASMNALFLITLFFVMVSFVAASDLCGMSCTKDATICKGSCGNCMSDDGGENFFCGSIAEEQLIAASRIAVNATGQAACGASCGGGNYCTTGSCIFCNCGPGGCGSTPVWKCYTSAMEGAKLLVPPGLLSVKKN